MNFLAHFFLSCDDPVLLTGNFMADFIQNRDVKTLPEEVQQGVVLHRKIDSFMDTHPLVRQGSRRLHARHHKYAPVVMDIFYDYFLYQHWDEFHDSAFQAFASHCYEILLDNLHLMPPALQTQTSGMINHNWLRNYTTKAGLRSTFRRLKKRTSKPQHLDGAVESLERDYELLDAEFLQFFPAIIEFVGCEIR